MRINYISGISIINEIYDEFNIKSDDWVNRVPNWIYKALRQLNSNRTYVDLYICGKFENNIILLPEYEGTIKLLSINDRIIINPNNILDQYTYNKNIELPIISDDNTFNINNALSQDSVLREDIHQISNIFNKQKYYINGNKLYTQYNTGIYKLWYNAIPTEFNDKLQTYIPLIPDIEKVIANIKWFVYKNILSRGYIHPIYSLSNRNQEYDPNIKWQNTIRGAKLALNEMDFNDRNEIANINMAFFNLPSYKTGQVDNIAELFKHYAI